MDYSFNAQQKQTESKHPPWRVHWNCWFPLMSFSFISWFKSLSVKEKTSLNGAVEVYSKVIGAQHRHLGSLWEKQVVLKATGNISQPNHVLSWGFTVMVLLLYSNVPFGWACRPSFLLLVGYWSYTAAVSSVPSGLYIYTYKYMYN